MPAYQAAKQVSHVIIYTLLMGYYINKGNNGFREARNSEYVDKSGLIREINATIGTKSKFSCMSR